MTGYTEFHPRWYRPRMSTWWWLRRPSYLLFILRELSSVFVAWSVVYLLLLVNAVRLGEDRYREFLDWSSRPWPLVLNVVALLFVGFHAVTWFNLTPKAVAPHVRGRPVPPTSIAASAYVGWVVVSAFTLWLLVGA